MAQNLAESFRIPVGGQAGEGEGEGEGGMGDEASMLNGHSPYNLVLASRAGDYCYFSSVVGRQMDGGKEGGAGGIGIEGKILGHVQGQAMQEERKWHQLALCAMSGCRGTYGFVPQKPGSCLKSSPQYA